MGDKAGLESYQSCPFDKAMSMNKQQLTIAMPAPGFFPNLGGAEIGLHNVAKRLKNRGHRPVVISSWKHVRALRKRGIVMPYEVVAYPPYCLSHYRNHANIIQVVLNQFYNYLSHVYKFDVAHINYTFPTGVSFVRWQESKSKKLPFLIQSVGDDIQKQPEINYGMRLDSQIESFVQKWVPQAPMVTAVSDSVRQEFLGLRIAEEKIRMVPYGVDVQRFSSHKPSVSKEQLFRCSSDTFVFLCVGRNHPKKNFVQPLRAFKQLLTQENKNCLLVYVGNGNEALQANIDELDLNGKVLLRKPPPMEQNKYDNIPADGLLDYYHLVDCFVMPSITETFGIVIAEAMASGLPVIAADAPGCRDVTDYGRYALTYQLPDDEALMMHMRALMQQPETCQHYRSLSRERVDVFDWEVITDKYLECYYELLNNNM